MLSLFRLFVLCLLIFAPMLGRTHVKVDTFDNPNLLSVGLGVFDIIKNPTNAMLQLEYKTTFTHWRKARPLVGIFATDKGGVYAYGGIGIDIFFGKRVVATPSFAPGLYYRGNGKKLWFPLEFRSSMELAYVFKNKNRLGAQFYHISNASIGRSNPGVEALVLNYYFAL